jgi:hypothetical protein
MKAQTRLDAIKAISFGTGLLLGAAAMALGY